MVNYDQDNDIVKNSEDTRSIKILISLHRTHGSFNYDAICNKIIKKIHQKNDNISVEEYMYIGGNIISQCESTDHTPFFMDSYCNKNAIIIYANTRDINLTEQGVENILAQIIKEINNEMRINLSIHEISVRISIMFC